VGVRARVGVFVGVKVGVSVLVGVAVVVVAVITVPSGRRGVRLGVEVKVGTMPIDGEGVAVPSGMGRTRLGVGGCSAMTEVGLIRPDLGGTRYIISSIKPPKTKKLRIPRATMMSTHDSGVSFLIVYWVWIFLFYSSSRNGAPGPRSARLVLSGLSRTHPRDRVCLLLWSGEERRELRSHPTRLRAQFLST
jgi:hypothetical protein